jgi:hypothetical protein
MAKVECCPSALENPCNICPDGASAGESLVPYADHEDSRTCKDLIEFAASFEAGSEQCSLYFDVDAAICCPNATASENPCSICPDGATAGDEFVPFTTPSYTCMELIAEAKLLESDSYSFKFYEGYEISCCPSVAADTTAAPVEETSTSATTAAIPEIDGGTASTTAALVKETTTTAAPVEDTSNPATTPTIPESTDTASGGVSFSMFGGFAFVFIASAFYAVGFV